MVPYISFKPGAHLLTHGSVFVNSINFMSPFLLKYQNVNSIFVFPNGNKSYLS